MTCPNRVVCPTTEFLGEDTPFANLSAERVDELTFLGINWGNPQTPPRLGELNTGYPPGICQAKTIQEAILCAGRNGVVNQYGSYYTPPVVPGTPPKQPQIFYNQQVSCDFVCPDGLPFTWTVAAGQFNDRDQATADAKARDYACKLAAKNQLCVGKLADGCQNVAYSSTVPLKSAHPPVGVDIVSGSLPPGLVMSQDPQGRSFTVSGTPTASGSFTFTLLATDSWGNVMQKNYTINILGISNINSLPAAEENTAYSVQLVGAGGTGPFTFMQSAGTLPGLTISSSGLITGTPNYVTAGDYPFTVWVTDSTGNSCAVPGTIHVNLRPGPDWTKLVWTTGKQELPPDCTVDIVAVGNIVSGRITKGPGHGTFWTYAFANGILNGYIGPRVWVRAIWTMNLPFGFAGAHMPFAQTGAGSTISMSPSSVSSGVVNVDTFLYPSALTGCDFSIGYTPFVAGNEFAGLYGLDLAGDFSFTVAIVNV